MSRRARVAIPVPADTLFTYEVPEGNDIPPGTRVLVPFGTRTVTGVVVDYEPNGSASSQPLKSILQVVDVEPPVPPPLMELALWVAEYYVAAPGQALSLALPSRFNAGSAQVVVLTDAGARALEADEGLSARQRALLERLAGRGPVSRGSLTRALKSGGRGKPPVSAPSSIGLRKDDGRGDVWGMVANLRARGLVEVGQALRGRPRSFRAVAAVGLTRDGTHALVSGEPLAPRRREALQRVASEGGLIARRALRAGGAADGAVAWLIDRGYLAVMMVREERDPFAGVSDAAVAPAGATPAVQLTADQRRALERLGAAFDSNGFRPVLLHGVTGSGKTELYLRVAERALARGRTALVLVPEIALTPMLARSFRARLGDRVALAHSGLSHGERHDQWQRIRRGDVAIVVGARSAVFAPLANVGVVIVDEEHDASYKQEEAPRYHARDVAVVRARNAGALVVLGSATPSLESSYNADRGRYERIELPRRIQDRELAATEIVDMRAEYAREGPSLVLSARLVDALDRCRARRDQALVLLNRRGYAASIFCRECAQTAGCPNCSVSLTIHLAARRARCHYCGYTIRIPVRCPACGGEFLHQAGFGTERVEREIQAAFPSLRVARLDRDTARRRHGSERLLDLFGAGRIDVLVGTQMIAKGHDFPRVTLVGVVSADVGLGLSDFRAAERTFQLLTQVAGRAGRGEQPGEAVIQTLYPEHYSIRAACAQDYLAFYRQELEFRRAMRYPPFVGLVSLVVTARSEPQAMKDATALARALAAEGPDAFEVLGPSWAPIARLKGMARAQILLKGARGPHLRDALRTALRRLPALARRVSIDVDPVSLM